MGNTITKKEHLIVPEVFESLIRDKFSGTPVMMQFAIVSDALKNTPGETIKFPKYALLGDLEKMTDEEKELALKNLTQTTQSVTIEHYGKAVEISDMALETGIGDPIDETGRQFAEIFARKIDEKLVDVAKTTALSVTAKKNEITAANVLDALSKYGDKAGVEDIQALVVHSKFRANFYKMPEFVSITNSNVQNHNGIQRGQYIGDIFGIPVIISDRVGDYSLLLKKNSLSVIYKRDFNIEFDRNIRKKSTVIAADIMFAVALLSEIGVVAIKHTQS